MRLHGIEDQAESAKATAIDEVSLACSRGDLRVLCTLDGASQPHLCIALGHGQSNRAIAMDLKGHRALVFERGTQQAAGSGHLAQKVMGRRGLIGMQGLYLSPAPLELNRMDAGACLWNEQSNEVVRLSHVGMA